MCTGIEYEYIQCSFNICKAVEHAPETRLRKEIKYIHKTYKRKVRSLNPNPDQPVSDSTIVGQAFIRTVSSLVFPRASAHTRTQDLVSSPLPFPRLPQV